MSDAVLRVAGLAKAFHGVEAVHDVSFAVGAGELVALIGPNGAGKTTCFNLVNGQLAPDAGTVTLSGKNLKDTSIKLVALDGVQPTLANLNTGVWKIAKPSYMTVSSDPTKVKPAIKALVEFVKSAEGQKIISGE